MSRLSHTTSMESRKVFCELLALGWATLCFGIQDVNCMRKTVTQFGGVIEIEDVRQLNLPSI